MPIQSDKIIWKKYFILKVIYRDCILDILLHLIEKNEVYLSSNGELNSPLEMAHLESRMLAEQFSEACIKRLKKRYGDMFDLHIVECSTRLNKTIQKRIKIDSDKIKQQLGVGNIASNRRPKSAAMPARKEHLCSSN